MGFKELVASDAHGQHGAVRLGLRYFVTPTVSASILLRAADQLLEAGWTWPSRIVRARLANKHGVHIAEGARIGPGFRLPHPVNVVIGPGTEIGSSVSVYQGVTLGAVAPRTQEWEFPRLGDGVTVYANAVVAGDITIGDNAVIGAGAIVTESVPAGTVVVGHNVVVRSTSEERTRVSNRESEGPARAAPSTPEP